MDNYMHTTFSALGVPQELCEAVEEMGFEHPMPVQAEVIPLLLNTDNDLIALAQTGTGKTAAYGLPCLAAIRAADRSTQTLILCPTRELCLQIADDLKDYSRRLSAIHVAAIYGGTSVTEQKAELRRGVHIIVATPGRLLDLIQRGAAHVETIRTLVLDEADEMLNMGFKNELDAIIAHLPEYRRTLLFSATMSKEVESIAHTYLSKPEEVIIGTRNEGAENVSHIYFRVQAKDKYLALKRVVDFYPRIYGIVFCRTRAETQEVADHLIRDGYNAEALHGDLSQQQRDITMQKFRMHVTQLLVATDVAARGLDVEDLTHVIHYSLPDDTESYTHRSGRTGRAGKKGLSVAIIHTREQHKVKAIEKAIGKHLRENTLPTPRQVCTKQLYRVIEQIEKADINEEEIAPFMPDITRRLEYMDKSVLIKKIVSREFGRFLSYYAREPEITTPPKSTPGQQQNRGSKGRRRQVPQKGYALLHINAGKSEGFYPGVIMQMINRFIPGRQEVGHIELYEHKSTVEVPVKDARRVAAALNGKYYRNKQLKVNTSE